VVIVAIAGYTRLGWRSRACPGLGAAGMAGFAVAAIGTTAWTRGELASLIAAWPGFAVLRDGQQFVAPLALTEAIGIGLVTAWITTGLAGQAPRRPGQATIALAVMAVIAPVLLLPGLAWGAAGRLHAVAYPADWLRARQIIERDRRPGAVVILPWAAYRRYSWNEGGAVLDPWPKLLRRPVLWNDALRVGPQTVAADNPAARPVAKVVAGPGSLTAGLRAAGVRYVLIDAGPLLPGDRAGPARCLAARARLPGARLVLASADLVLLRLPAAAPATGAAGPAKRIICPASGR
jgi:hypothetical protein